MRGNTIIGGVLMIIVSIIIIIGNWSETRNFRSFIPYDSKVIKVGNKVVVEGIISADNSFLVNDLVLANEFSGNNPRTREFKKNHLQPIRIDLKGGTAVVHFERGGNVCGPVHEIEKTDEALLYKGNKRGDAILVFGIVDSVNPPELVPAWCATGSLQEYSAHQERVSWMTYAGGGIAALAGFLLIRRGRRRIKNGVPLDLLNR